MRAHGPLLGAVALLMCIAMTAAAPAVQARERHPTAKELWREYPLAGATTVPSRPTAAPSATPARARAAGTRADAPARDGGGGFDAAWVVAGLLVAASAVPGWMLFGSRRREPAGEPERLPPPRRPAGAHEPMWQGREWIAEITWQQSGTECRFSVTATPARGGARRTVAESWPLDWPPAEPSGVEAMTDAVEALERSLLADGWLPLPPGEAWYAKRFASRPVGTRRLAPGRERAGSPS